jgi:MOSC domain-containing protein YiiM
MAPVSGRVLSVQVGRPGTLRFRGRPIRTAIFKEPVAGGRMLRREGFDGDEQADRRIHGGPDKAACAYPDEHMPDWEELVEQTLPPGAFGENLRLAGLLERDVHIGDVFAVGGATVEVSQPRGPCYKLATRWGRRRLTARMAREGISGWYFRVREEGEVAAGDELRLLERRSTVSVADAMAVTYGDRRGDVPAVRRVLAAPGLSEAWRQEILSRQAA